MSQRCNRVIPARHFILEQCAAKTRVRATTAGWSADLCCIQDADHEGPHTGTVNFSDPERSDKERPKAPSQSGEKE